MAMKQIFVRNNYRVMVDCAERKACIVKGTNSISVPLEPLTPLSTIAAKHLRMIGCDPAEYLNIGHTNQILLRDASPSWEQSLLEANQILAAKDTSMIPLFWKRLPGLLELREAEDNYAAGARSASLLLEQSSDSLLPKQLADLRERYPLTALYIEAEHVALSPDEKLAEKGRQAMALLINGGGIADALKLLPNKLPVNQHVNMRRVIGENQ